MNSLGISLLIIGIICATWAQDSTSPKSILQGDSGSSSNSNSAFGSNSGSSTSNSSGSSNSNSTGSSNSNSTGSSRSNSTGSAGQSGHSSLSGSGNATKGSGGNQSNSGWQQQHPRLHPDGIEQLQEDPNLPWIGRWESVPGQASGFARIIQVLGVQQFKDFHHDENTKVWYQFWKEGTGFKQRVQIPSEKLDKIVSFQLGQEGSTRINQEIKFKYDQEDKKLVIVFHAPQKNKLIKVQYAVNGDDMEATYKVGDAEAKRSFKRIRKSDLIPGSG